MSQVLDGISFDVPPTAGQIMALAQLHRKKLVDVISRDVRLGDYNLSQRKAVYDFTRQLDVQQREDFYKLYNGELIRLAEEDRLHPVHEEAGVSKFVIFIVLAIIALVLYFAIIRNVIH